MIQNDDMEWDREREREQAQRESVGKIQALEEWAARNSERTERQIRQESINLSDDCFRAYLYGRLEEAIVQLVKASEDVVHAIDLGLGGEIPHKQEWLRLTSRRAKILVECSERAWTNRRRAREEATTSSPPRT